MLWATVRSDFSDSSLKVKLTCETSAEHLSGTKLKFVFCYFIVSGSLLSAEDRQTGERQRRVLRTTVDTHWEAPLENLFDLKTLIEL